MRTHGATLVHGVSNAQPAGVGEVSVVAVTEAVAFDVGRAEVVVESGEASVCEDGVDGKADGCDAAVC